MIKSIKINNMKMFQNFSMTLPEGVSVIQGSNGCGKSALIELIYALTQLLAMPSSSDRLAASVDTVFPLKLLTRWMIQKQGFADAALEMEICSNEGKRPQVFKYELTVRYDFSTGKCRIENEILSLNSDRLVYFHVGTLEIVTDDNKTIKFNSDWNLSGVVTASRNNSKIREFGDLITKIFCLHLAPSAIKYSFERTEQSLNIDGSNFPAWRSYYASSHAENLSNIFEKCKYVIPGLISINDIKRGESQNLSIRVRYEKKDYDFSFDELSDGQRAVIILYSLLENVPSEAVLFIDEPENYLAPSELQPWLNAINDIWEEKDIQVIVASHNMKTHAWYNDNLITFAVSGNPPRVELKTPPEFDEETL